MAGRLRMCAVAWLTLIGASPMAMFLLTRNRGLVAPRGPLRRGWVLDPNPALGRLRLASGATPLLVRRRYA